MPTPNQPTPQITQLLGRASDGDSAAARDLLPLVYEELRKLAQARMAAEPNAAAGFTLQPTALVHEAYMRLVGPSQPSWNSRAHFFGAAALAMRRILVERARSVRSTKRGGGAPKLSLEADPMGTVLADDPRLVDLDGALERLEKIDPRRHEVVMLRYFAGLSVEQTAESLAVSAPTIKRDWAFARAWLARELAGAENDGNGAEA